MHMFYCLSWPLDEAVKILCYLVHSHRPLQGKWIPKIRKVPAAIKILRHSMCPLKAALCSGVPSSWSFAFTSALFSTNKFKHWWCPAYAAQCRGEEPSLSCTKSKNDESYKDDLHVDMNRIGTWMKTEENNFWKYCSTWAEVFAFASIRALTQLWWPLNAALCSGVAPSLSWQFTLAPFSIRRVTHFTWPLKWSIKKCVHFCILESSMVQWRSSILSTFYFGTIWALQRG